jgi:hypothetical protein
MDIGLPSLAQPAQPHLQLRRFGLFVSLEVRPGRLSASVAG